MTASGAGKVGSAAALDSDGVLGSAGCKAGAERSAGAVRMPSAAAGSANGGAGSGGNGSGGGGGAARSSCTRPGGAGIATGAAGTTSGAAGAGASGSGATPGTTRGAASPRRAAPGLGSGSGSALRTAPPKRCSTASPGCGVEGTAGTGTLVTPAVAGPRNVMLIAPHTPCPCCAVPPGALPSSSTSHTCSSSASATHFVSEVGGAFGHGARWAGSGRSCRMAFTGRAPRQWHRRASPAGLASSTTPMLMNARWKLPAQQARV